MPANYSTFSPMPPAASQTTVFDVTSGIYRPLLNTDFTQGTTSNGTPIGINNPMFVRMGGASASAFGETLTAEIHPEIQNFLTTIKDDREWQLFSGQNDGYTSYGTGLGVVNIGPTILAYSSIRTRKFLPYNPGQGAVYRFTAAFNTGVPNSFQLAGAYHAEDGAMFGYIDTGFGIIHRYGRKLEIRKLSITGPATVAGNVTVTLNGTPNTVRVGAEGNIWSDARNITTGTSYFENGPLGIRYDYETFQMSGDIYFSRNTHGPSTGVYSFNSGSTTCTGVWSLIQSGNNGTQDFYAITGWNVDKMDGAGQSAMTLNPQKLNVYEIKYGWLGALPLKFSVSHEGKQEMVPVHYITWSNTKNIPSFEDPRFPVAYSVASAGSTVPIAIYGASVFGALEGHSDTRHNEFSFTNEVTAGTTETPILSIINSRVNVGNANFNRRRFHIDSIYLSNESATKAATIKVYVGDKTNLKGFNFQYPGNNDTIAILDTSSTAINNSSSLELITSLGVSPTTVEKIDVNRSILPQEVLILTSKTSSSSAVIIASVNGYEDN